MVHLEASGSLPVSHRSRSLSIVGGRNHLRSPRDAEGPGIDPPRVGGILPSALAHWAARGTVASQCVADMYVFAAASVTDAGSENEIVDAHAGAGSSNIVVIAVAAGG